MKISGVNVFYGWWVLAGVFLIYTANNGILVYTLPLFYPQLIGEFGWNAEQVTRPASLFFIVAALITPFMGILFDRYPTRNIMLAGILALIVTLACYPLIRSLDQLMAIYLAFAFGLAACGLVPNMLILTRWFRRYRGIAVGILLTGSSLGGAIFPLLARETLVSQGWRPAILLVAALGSVMMLAGVVFLVRNHPRDLGLEVDGGASPDTPPDRVSAAPSGPTLKQAMMRPAFYILAVITGILWFCIVGMIQHQSIFFGEDLGVPTATLAVVFSLFFWFAIVGKFLFGYLGDVFNKVFIMFVSTVNLLIGLAMLRILSAENVGLLYFYAILCGVGFGGAFSMIQLVLAEYFSGSSYGKILAVFTMVDSLCGAMGIKYLGHARVAGESYLPAFNLLVLLCLVSALLILVLMITDRISAGRFSA